MPPAPRRQRKRSEATRTALIRAAIEVLGERGYAGTTAAIIAARAQVTRGALQHHFGGIDALYVEVVAYVSREKVGAIEAEIAAHDALDQQMSAIAERYWRVYAGADYEALLEIWIGSRHDAALRGEIAALMQRITDTRNDYWQVMLGALGLTREERDVLRATLLSTVRGAAIHRLFDQDDARGLRQVQFILDLFGAWLAQRGTSTRRTGHGS